MFDWKWPESTYRRVGYLFESGFLEGITKRFLYILVSLIKNGGTLRKCYLILYSIKTFEISAYIFNRIFTKNVNNFEILRQIFP